MAKLYIDQALPSAGTRGSIVVARALARRGMARPLAITVVAGPASMLVVAARMCFLFFSVALLAASLAVSGRRTFHTAWSARIPMQKRTPALPYCADRKCLRSPSILVRSPL
jgi:hypothetical protein